MNRKKTTITNNEYDPLAWIDVYPMPVCMYYDRRLHFKTVIGRIFSVIVVVLLICLFAWE